MDIQKLFEALNNEEKSKLLYLIQVERGEAKKLLIFDWIDKMQPSVRLSNVLKKYGNDKYIEDITEDDFSKKQYRWGQKAWSEFEELRGY